MEITINATAREMGVIKEKVGARLSSEGFGDVVVLENELRFVDHGQNPVGDDDLRASFLVRSHDRSKPYRGYGDCQLGDRFIMGALDANIGYLIGGIREHKGLN